MRKMMMPAVCMMLAALMLAVGSVGCATSEPGVSSTHRSQTTTVAADPADVTDAAKAVLNDMQLKKVHGNATSVDGQVMGYTADNTEVNVSIHKNGANTSEVSVTVGNLGNPSMGLRILNQIEDKIGG